MWSTNLCWNVIAVINYLPLTYAGYAGYQEPVHYARISTSSSSSQTVRSSKSSTSSTTYQSFSAQQPGQSFPLGRSGVTCHYRFYDQRGSQKSLNSPFTAGSAYPSLPLAHLTPFDCHVNCASHAAAAPNKNDCQKIMNAMKNSKKESITIAPHSVFSVEYKQCAIVFENSSPQNIAVNYGWRRLTDQAARLQNQCPLHTQGAGYSSGHPSQNVGMCYFSRCDVENSIHKNPNRSTRSTSTQNSGIVITIERNRSPSVSSQ